VDKKEGTRSGNLSGKGLSRINRNLLVFAFFLVLSFVFWYLNSLGKELETNIRYPVNYINFPDNRSLAEELPSKLNLSLKGHGYSILRLKITSTGTPVTIDFSKTRYKRIENSKQGDFCMVTSGLIPNFNLQLKSECKITSIRPDTLFFSFK
jgi:hypothetical protein